MPNRGLLIRPGFVADNEDPQQMGRIRFRAAWLDNKVHPAWAVPMFQHTGNGFGFFSVPKQGTMIDIVTDDRSPGVMRWIATQYLKEEGIPAEAKDDYPFTIVWGSEAGYILINDKTGTIMIVHRNSNASVKLTKDNIVINSGGEIKIDSTGVTLENGSIPASGVDYLVEVMGVQSGPSTVFGRIIGGASNVKIP